MILSEVAIDLFYLILYGLEPVLELAAAGLLVLATGEVLVHAIGIIRR